MCQSLQIIFCVAHEFWRTESLFCREYACIVNFTQARNSQLTWGKKKTNRRGNKTLTHGFDVDNDNLSHSKISKLSHNIDYSLYKSNIILGLLFNVMYIGTYKPVFLLFQTLCSDVVCDLIVGKCSFQVRLALWLNSVDIFSQNSITQHWKKNELDYHCYYFCCHVGLLGSNFSNFRPLGILQHPTLIWFRNLKGRNIRPYPIKLWRICMHQEKSGFVIYICDIVLNRQAYGQRHRLQTSISVLV